MLFFETNSLGFSTEFLGQVRLVASMASLAGVGIYNFALKRTPLRKMFFWSAVLGTGLGMTQLVLITGGWAAVEEGAGGDRDRMQEPGWADCWSFSSQAGLCRVGGDWDILCRNEGLVRHTGTRAGILLLVLSTGGRRKGSCV